MNEAADRKTYLIHIGQSDCLVVDKFPDNLFSSQKRRKVLNLRKLLKESVWAKFAHTAADGKVYDVDICSLDVIISVGYRVKSKRGTQFRIWEA